MKLSKNLSLQEVVKSNTAIKYGINNNPTEEHLKNLQFLAVNGFQVIRDYFGKPIFVSSGYRSEALNERIGGSKTSQHSTGQALDLDTDVYGGITNGELFDFIRSELDFDQLIWEFGNNSNPDWVHFSMRSDGKNRGQILRASRIGGKVIYSIYE